MKKEIEIRGVTCLRGPNMWTYRSVVEARVDIGGLEDSPSNTLPGFCERLTAWLPTLSEHRCSYGEAGGFLKRLSEGTWPGHILEHVTLELQNLAGMPGGFGRARETSVRGVYKVVIRAWHETVTEAALHAGRDLVMAAIDDRPFDVGQAVATLRRLADDVCLGPSTACIVTAAERSQIPTIRLSEGNLVQLGHGAQQHRIWRAETDLTSAIAQGIARDKDLSRGLLKSVGVPVPDGMLVKSREAAWEAATELGGAVVVKPNDTNHGRAVFTNLTRREDVESAFAAAREESRHILVEQFVSGFEHRLLVIGDRVIAAMRGAPVIVTGDGTSDVRELIARQINSDVRRGTSPTCPLDPIVVDAVVQHELQRQGYSPEAIPPKGLQLFIRRHGDLDSDVTDQVHPTTARTAVLAVRVIGLDIAGVDLVAEDIAQPLEQQGGAVIAINSAPALLPHLQPAAGNPRPVGEAIVDHLFPDGANGRIPIVGITGTSGTTMIARLLARLVELSGRRVGLACRDGLYLDHREVESCDCANWGAAKRILLNRGVDAAVLENDALSLVGEGLAYDRCQVAIVTAIDPAARIPEFDITTAEQMFNVLRTQVDVVLPAGSAVLNAHDPLVAEMAPLCDGDVIFFATDPTLEVLSAHRAGGGRSVVVDQDRVLLGVGHRDTTLTDMARLTANFRVDAHEIGSAEILATIGAAWALGISEDIICAGIECFDQR